MNEFFKSLQPGIELDSNTIKEIQSLSTLVNVKSPRILLSAPQVQDRIYFIREGVIRRYSIINGKESTNWFFSKGNFAVSEDSFFIDEASEEYLETTGPSLLIEIRKKEFIQLISKYPEFEELIKRLYKKYIVSRREIQNIISQPGEDSYEWFRKNYAYTFDHIKLLHLANFLGITPQHLSRIRKELQKKDKS